MKNNMSSTDRIVRIVVAVILAALYFSGVITGTVGTILTLLAIVFLLTATIGFCPLYTLFGMSTKKKAQ